MRKFIFNANMLGALFGALSIAKVSRQGPRDWRLALMWIGWGITVAIAVGTVIDEANTASNELEE